MEKLSKKDLIFMSFMLFSMFFGAGNLIFPPYLGSMAGDHVWLALIGFILSAVGLPLLGVAAIARTGSFDRLAGRVHPLFALLFPLAIYLCIGPALGIPRAGSLAFEMGIKPLLPSALADEPVSLFLYSLCFYSLVLWLSRTPSKLVERFGKLLTPLLLILILLIFLKSLFSPLPPVGAPQGQYFAHPVFQGFLDGYQTGDALGALAFGIVVANAIRSKGIESNKKISTYMMRSGLLAGGLLTILYLILGSLGAASASFGRAENGAQTLSNVMNSLFGAGGTLLLGAVFFLACLCVSIGLTTSCSQYFATLSSRVSYQTWVNAVCAVSLIIANLGLTNILAFSLPLLGLLYPVAIVLILLALSERSGGANVALFRMTVCTVLLYSGLDLINQTLLSQAWNSVFSRLPLYSVGAGWILPALVAGCFSLMFRRRAAIGTK
ncbi:branched-chain amino acid transport system II carrier protein [Tumebacillus lipolyticus]|uniref:Branched-chain amino acid transport system carrier protein n=1 Tax=Tumebacillus lipolyticus TaxID=1280370 RepID=A0ABW4ZT10_9BACL